MNLKKIVIVSGTVLSIVLLVIVLIRLDWQTFFTTLKTIRFLPVLLAVSAIMTMICLRSLRWNLIADLPLTQFKYFWQALNIGYLGNFIYPIRAGEVLRIGAIHRFTSLTLGHAATSAVIDRIVDVITLGLFMLVILWLHGRQIDPNIGTSVVSVFFFATVFLTMLMVYIDFLYKKAQGWTVQGKWKQIKIWYLHALEGIQAFRQARHLLAILPLSVLIFFVDFYGMWQIMQAFSWSLPFDAALTTGVFLIVGVSLPSTPGYIGVYQVACIFALGLYGVDHSSAVAYSIVLQLVNFTVIGLQGGAVTAYCGFNLSKERQLATLK